MNEQPAEPPCVLLIRASGEMALGAEEVVIQLASMLPQQGWKASILTVTDARDQSNGLFRKATALGLNVHEVLSRGRLDPSIVTAIRSLAVAQRATVLHSHGYKENLHTLAARTGLPTIATNHLWKRSTLKLRLYALLDSLLIGRFNATVGVSAEICEEMRNLPFVRSSRVSYVSNGIRLSSSASSRERGSSLERPLIITTVSSLTAEKGITYLIDALAAPAVARLHWRLRIIGDGPLREALEAQVRERSLQERVDFLGFRSDVPSLLEDTDTFVLPSLSEGLPMALLEAMAAGCSIVASSVGQVPHALSTPECGILVPPADPKALGGALTILIADPEIRDGLGSAAREAVKRFSSEQMARAYASLYRDILGDTAHSRTDPATTRNGDGR